jgi:hypothetical protein
MSCSIGALLAAISFMTQPSSNVVLANITSCTLNPSSAACYRLRADEAEEREKVYRETVTDAVMACALEDGFTSLFPYCATDTYNFAPCRVEP